MVVLITQLFFFCPKCSFSYVQSHIVKFQGGANIQQGGAKAPPPPYGSGYLLTVHMAVVFCVKPCKGVECFLVGILQVSLYV